MKLFKTIGLYLEFAKISVKKEMVYRASFFTGVVGQWLSYGATFATLFIMVSSFQTLAGWTADEVMFMYAFNLLSYALAASVFFNPCTQLSTKIRTGEFDAVLTKPVTPLAHEIYNGYNFGYIGHTILSVFILCISMKGIHMPITVPRILLFLVMLFGAALVQGAFLLVSSCFSFFSLSGNPVADFLLFDFKSFTQYPITIYGIGIQILLTYILPFAFMNYYPAVAILNKSTPTGFPDWLPYLTPAVGIILLALSIKIWYWALSKYQSTGT